METTFNILDISHPASPPKMLETCHISNFIFETSCGIETIRKASLSKEIS